MIHSILPMLLLVASPTQPAKDQTIAKGGTRVAVVDIGRVFCQGLPNGSDFGRSFSPEILKLNEKAKPIVRDIKEWQTALENKDLSSENAESYRRMIRKAEGQLDLIRSEIQKRMETKQEDTLVGHWKDVQRAIKTYATDNGIDIVLGYGDPREEEMLNSYPNVKRKMETIDLGGTVPLFVAPHADITDGVIRVLIKQRQK